LLTALTKSAAVDAPDKDNDALLVAAISNEAAEESVRLNAALLLPTSGNDAVLVAASVKVPADDALSAPTSLRFAPILAFRPRLWML
jgi:hypothetical protein